MAVALVVAGVMAYANSLGAPFILDDEDVIVRNPYVASLWPLSDAMRAPVQSSVAGRPLVSLSLAISHATGGGLSPAAFRIFNVAFLITSALVLGGIVRRTVWRVTGDPAQADAVAFSSALLWLLHPLNSEVVGYVTQSTESMMGLFYLLTLYAAIRAVEASHPARWTAVAVLSCAAGMACKESMVTAPVMVLLYDIVFFSRSVTRALARRMFLYGGLASTWLLLLALNIAAPRSGSAGFSTTTSLVTYLLNQAVMIVTYLKLSIWPSPLLIDYGRTAPITLIDALPYVVGVTALLLGTAVAWRRHRVLAFLGTWFFVTLAPSSSVIPIASEVGAERRMYLPLIAIVVLVVIGLQRVVARRFIGARAVVFACATVAIALGAVTMARNRDYFDQMRLWQDAIEHRPHGRAHYNLAIVLKAAGRSDESMAHYRAALPDEPAAHYALGFEASQAGRDAEAISQLQEFLRRRPADVAAPNAALLLGAALERSGRRTEAERVLRDLLAMSPQNADAIGALADLLLREGRHADAAVAYGEYLTLRPDTPNALHGLGLALASRGNAASALPAFQQAVDRKPTDPQFRMSLATALASTGRLREAITQYRAALRLAPSNPQIMSSLAFAVADSGARDESLALFERALAAAPGDPIVQDDYRRALALMQQRR